MIAAFHFQLRYCFFSRSPAKRELQVCIMQNTISYETMKTKKNKKWSNEAGKFPLAAAALLELTCKFINVSLHSFLPFFFHMFLLSVGLKRVWRTLNNTESTTGCALRSGATRGCVHVTIEEQQ